MVQENILKLLKYIYLNSTKMKGGAYELDGIIQLVKITKLSRQSISRLMKSCKENNFLLIEKKPNDKRLSLIRLTPKGEYYLKKEIMFLEFERDLKKFDEDMRKAFP